MKPSVSARDSESISEEDFTPAPRIVIVGRPNVGKSTLFNRLFGRKKALVHDLPGVTRDRLEERVEWWVRAKRYELKVVDTGGLGGERFAEEIARQVQLALDEADLVLALFDSQAGYTSADQEVVQRMIRSGLRARDLPIIGVVNKVDDPKHEENVTEFYAAGLDELVAISAEHGVGIEDLKEHIIDALTARGEISPVEEDAVAEEAYPDEDFESEDGEESEETRGAYERRVPHVAIVGKPNVGKSTLVNALLGQDRMITSPIAGTTVDAVDSLCEIGGKPYLLIDTAGIRRKNKTEQGVEVLSVVLSRKALERCEIALLVVDGEEGIADQDEKIGGMIEDVGCSVVVVVNKWDTQARNAKFSKDEAADRIRKQMTHLRFAPIMFVSALKGQGLEDLGALIDDILEQRRLKISTHVFTEWVREESEIHNPGNVKFYMSHMAGRNPPTFVSHVSKPEKVHFSLKRHLINAIREKWGFVGSPVRMLFIEGSSRKGPKRRVDSVTGSKASSKPARDAAAANTKPRGRMARKK